MFGTNLPPVDFHGFASQGYVVNTGNNDYLGGDSHDGSFDFREYGINGSIAYGKLRVGAQIFAQKLGPYGGDNPTLDWGTVDYHAEQWFGVRAGRVKMPRGLYNESLDLDSTRPFVFLPQSIYDARLRDFNSAINGGEFYGNIELSKAGSLDYTAFMGSMPIANDSGAIDYFNTSYSKPTISMSMEKAYGGTMFWNTPVTGLRVGYSPSVLDGLKINRMWTPTLPYVKSADPIIRQMVSAEYVTGKWTFAAEAEKDYTSYHVVVPGLPKVDYDFNSLGAYVSASRRMNKWLELGTYYSVSQDTSGISVPLTQNDVALCAKFDLTENLIFKLEGHYLDGAGKVFDTPSNPQPLAQRDTSWLMMAAKVTFSF